MNDLAAMTDKLLSVLDELTAPYVPPPEEVKLLEQALALLIAARDRREFGRDEETVWNCGSITIDGRDRGAWEIRICPKEDN
jgi:hypothetical protein